MERGFLTQLRNTSVVFLLFCLKHESSVPFSEQIKRSYVSVLRQAGGKVKMGNSMIGLMYKKHVSEPENMPDEKQPPTFDPLYGFPNGRKERGMHAM